MKEKIRDYIKSLGVDDVGFADVADYISPNSPEIRSFFPEAQSIIVMAYRELSTCESSEVILAMNGRMNKDEVMHADSYRIGHFLDDEFNARILCIPQALPLMGTRALFSLRHAAVAAGLGTFGRHNLVIHPRFGTRVTFTAILTDLKLDSDKRITEDFCSNCDICVKNCPAKALDEKGKTDVSKCMMVSQPFSFMSELQFYDEYAAADSEKKRKLAMKYWPYYQANSIGLQYCCFNCLKLCPACRNKEDK